MKRELAAFLVLAGMIMLYSFLSTIDFSNTDFEGLIGGGAFPEKQAEGSGSIELSQNETSIASNSNPPCIPILAVSGLDSDHFRLRHSVSSEYRNGRWIENVSYNDPMEFENGKIFAVKPLITLKGNLPVPKDTVAISIPAKYNRSAGLFYYDAWNQTYYGVYKKEELKSIYAGKARLARLEIDPWKMEKIRELTIEITKNERSDYEKLKRIEEFLRDNYDYSPSYPYPPEKVYEFLFVGKRGICSHFAHAFIAMATSINIPVRAVFGYLAKPTGEEQVVYACQAHMWAEARLGDSWVEFDPTPDAREKIKTSIEIVHWDRRIVKGENLTVVGIVRTENNRGVESGYVEVYLKKDKKGEGGTLIGIARIENGTFSLKSRVNLTGRYSIVAHYVGSLLYQESWSDPEVSIYSIPNISLELPYYIPENYLLKGKVLDGNKGLPNKTVKVVVDGEEHVTKTDSNGTFVLSLNLSRGTHTLEIVSPEENFYEKVRLERAVKVGSLDVRLLNSTLKVGKQNDVKLEIQFNQEPFSGAVYVNGVRRHAENGLLSFNFTPETPGKAEMVVRIGALMEKLSLNAKSSVFITARQEDDRLVVKVEDGFNSRINGIIYINNDSVELVNGTAVYEEKASRYEIFFPGDEYHFPKKIVYSPTFNYSLLLIPISLGIAGFLIWKSRKYKLDFHFEKEHPELPEVWKVGEEIRLRIDANLPYTVVADGRIFENALMFERKGVYEVSVRLMRDSKVVKERRALVRIVKDYGEGVELVFREFERELEKRGIDVKALTAREILRLIECNEERFLKLFELYEYAGKRGYSRKQFIEAFELYMQIKRCMK